MAPPPGRIDFRQVAGYSDSYSSFVLTDRGAVNYYRSGVAANSHFAPLDGENRFSTFSIPDTSNTVATVLFAREMDIEDDNGLNLSAYAWREDDTVRKVDLIAGTMALAATVAESSGHPLSISTPDASPYGYALFFSGPRRLWRWSRSSEPVAASEFYYIDSSVGSITTVDANTANGNIWLGADMFVNGQDAAAIRLLSPEGVVLLTVTLEDGSPHHGYTYSGDANAFDSVISMAAWGDDLIFYCFNNGAGPEGDYTKIFHATQAGTITEITNRCFIDGVPLAEAMAFSDLDSGRASCRRNRIHFEDGSTLLAGVITPASAAFVVVGTHFNGGG